MNKEIIDDNDSYEDFYDNSKGEINIFIFIFNSFIAIKLLEIGVLGGFAAAFILTIANILSEVFGFIYVLIYEGGRFLMSKLKGIAYEERIKTRKNQWLTFTVLNVILMVLLFLCFFSLLSMTTLYGDSIPDFIFWKILVISILQGVLIYKAELRYLDLL